MTQFNKTTLKTFFETNDVPQGSDFANLIDSYVNQVETGLQSMAGPLQATELVAPRVSAGNVNVTGTLTVTGTQSISSLTLSGNLAGTTANLTAVSATSLNVTGNVSADGTITTNALRVNADISANTGTVYASAMRVGAGLFRNVTIVSAAGSTQATGASLGQNGVCRLKGIVDGQTTGFILNANSTGLQQTLWVEENTSCNLWPCTGGQINALSSNAAFALTGNTQYIVTHIKASGYSVK